MKRPLQSRGRASLPQPFGNAAEHTGHKLNASPGLRSESRFRVIRTILVLVCLQLPFGNLVPGNTLAAQVGREGLFWLATFLLVGYIVYVERRPLSSIGLLRPTWKSLTFGVAAALMMVAGSALLYLVIFPALRLSANEAALRAVQATPIWFQLLVLVRAPVFEEIYYRGFMIERLTEIIRFRWLAALISLTAFTFAHLQYWGWDTLIVIAFEGAVATGLYLLRRDLCANIAAHFLVDATAFLFA